MRPNHLLPAVALVAACARPVTVGTETPPPAAPPAPETVALAYGPPAAASVEYELGDTADIDMQAGDQAVRVELRSRGAAQLDFAPADAGVRATVRLTELRGELSNSMGPTVTVGEESLPGPAVVRVTPTGVVVIEQPPEFPEELAQIVGPNELLRRFFIRLPGREVEPGTAWTDTITVRDETPGGLTSETTSIVRSVWARDTTIRGNRLAVIESRLDNRMRVEGTTQGIEIRQSLQGQAAATTLWDPERRIVVRRIESGRATGTTDLPSMGITGMPVTAVSRSTLRLRGF